MNRVENRKLIIEILKKHPEGLTIASIAKISGLHRHTSTKYIYELIGAGLILQRSVGSAKLCYLKKINENEEKKILENLEKRRCIEKYNFKLVLSVVFITFLLSEATILAYENISFNETFTNGSNTSPLTSSFILNESEILENALNSSVENETINESIEFNETIEMPLENEIIVSNETGAVDISLEYPERITRGEEFSLKAFVKNINQNSIKNVKVSWILPDEAEVISTNSSCENLEPDNSCFSEIIARLSLSTKLGKNDFKVVVNYEE
ncbi:MAG: hypothetical protein QXD55_01625 [Candidatus Aenigmatarchaeota archaeon]